MGGNALKNCGTRRYQAEEYAVLAGEMLARLRTDFPRGRAALLPAYRTKPDFGDMDILVAAAAVPGSDLQDWAMETWAPREIVGNGRVLSFECRELQIDLIGQEPENFDSALAYYSWNDLGNFLGRIAHRMGLRYGHDGLSVLFRDGNHQFAERVVSRDTDRILTFLGYDAPRWRAGFDTLEDIYRFAASTAYFNPAIFAYENRNHTARVRDRKRAVYRGFLDWMERRADLPAYPWPSATERGGRRFDEATLLRLLAAFPEFEPEYRSVMAGFALWRQAKTLFNGETVAGMTGLAGPVLGAFMHHLAAGRGAAFHAEIVGMGASGVEKWVRGRFAQWTSPAGRTVPTESGADSRHE